jgi:hypothetical protein
MEAVRRPLINRPLIFFGSVATGILNGTQMAGKLRVSRIMRQFVCRFAACPNGSSDLAYALIAGGLAIAALMSFEAATGSGPTQLKSILIAMVN